MPRKNYHREAIDILHKRTGKEVMSALLHKIAQDSPRALCRAHDALWPREGSGKGEVGPQAANMEAGK